MRIITPTNYPEDSNNEWHLHERLLQNRVYYCLMSRSQALMRLIKASLNG